MKIEWRPCLLKSSLEKKGSYQKDRKLEKANRASLGSLLLGSNQLKRALSEYILN